MSEQEQDNTPDIYQAPLKKRSFFNWKIALIATVCVIAIVYSLFDTEQKPSQQDLAYQAYVDQFDERLLACNDVKSAEPTDSFNTCLAAAEDGSIEAKKVLVWAYARNGDYQDWQKVFDWLKQIQYRDKETQLLLFSILHLMADTDELKEQGEKGIKNLVTKNFAPANIILASIYALEQNQLPKSSSALWLLNRSFEQQPELIDPTLLALIYANGWLSAPNVEKGAQVLKHSAQEFYPVLTNNIAWFLSTLDQNPFTNNEYALELAKKVVEDAENAKNPTYVDTLAATYAANGMFDDAISTQRQAIQLIEESNYDNERKARELNDFTSRLNVYLENRPLVESNFDAEKEQTFKRLKSRVVDYLFANFKRQIVAPSMPNAETTQ